MNFFRRNRNVVIWIDSPSLLWKRKSAGGVETREGMAWDRYSAT